MNDAVLLRRARKFDTTALGRIHDEYYPHVYRYVLYRVGDPVVTEDLAAETFVRLLDALKSGRAPRKSLRGWLIGVANHLATDHFREAARHPQAELDETLVAAENPALEAELNLRRENMRNAMTTLTPEQQHVLALRFGGGYSIAETAELMGKKENAIKALQYRAVEALRRTLVP